MTERSDDELLDDVRQVWEERDPVPAGLLARLQATTALAAGDLDLDLELMTLVERSHDLAGARGTASAASSYTLRFTHTGMDLLVRVQGPGTGGGPGGAGGGTRIDCWLVPSSPALVRVLLGADSATRTRPDAGPTVDVDATGRFEVTGLPPGLIRVHVEPRDGSPTFVTPAFEI